MVETLGIDEAGRGPVLGPMVIAGVVSTPELDAEFAELGVKDSKQILPKKRELLFDSIKKKALAYHIEIISPSEIDAREKSGLNLNQLEAVTALKIMAAIQKKSGCRRVIVDSPSNNPKAFAEYVRSFLQDDSWEVIAEIKADVNHTSVAAASVLAKVTRDAAIVDMEKTIQSRLGESVMLGSGYPSDPVTKKFLSEYWNKLEGVDVFRKSWASYKVLGKNQKKLGDY